MTEIDKQFRELAKNGHISRKSFLQLLTGAGMGAEFAGIVFDSFDVDGNKCVSGHPGEYLSASERVILKRSDPCLQPLDISC